MRNSLALDDMKQL